MQKSPTAPTLPIPKKLSGNAGKPIPVTRAVSAPFSEIIVSLNNLVADVDALHAVDRHTVKRSMTSSAVFRRPEASPSSHIRSSSLSAVGSSTVLVQTDAAGLGSGATSKDTADDGSKSTTDESLPSIDRLEEQLAHAQQRTRDATAVFEASKASRSSKSASNVGVQQAGAATPKSGRENALDEARAKQRRTLKSSASASTFAMPNAPKRAAGAESLPATPKFEGRRALDVLAAPALLSSCCEERISLALLSLCSQTALNSTPVSIPRMHSDTGNTCAVTL